MSTPRLQSPTPVLDRGVPTWTLITIAAASAISPLATDMYLAAFPALGSELDVSSSAVQLTLTMFMVGFGVGQYLFGALSDRWGRRGLLIGGTALTLASSIGAALSPAIAVLWVMRLLQGFGAAAGTVLARAVVTDLATGVRRAQQMSLMMIIQGLAPIIAPVFGSALASSIGWRGIMIVLAAFTVVVLAALLVVVPETLAAEHRLDAPMGTVVLAPLKVLSVPRFTFLALGAMLGFGALMAYVSGSSYVLEGIFGLDAFSYGLVFAINAGMLGVVGGINARLVTHWQPERLSQVGAGLMTVGALGALLDSLISPGLVTFVTFVTIAAAGVGLCLSNLVTLALNCLPADRQGSGSAVIGTGQALCAAVISPLVGLGGDTTAAPTAAVMLACALGGVAVIAAAWRLRPGRTVEMTRP